MFRQLTKSEVKQIADIMLKQVFKRAEEKGIKIDVTGGWGHGDGDGVGWGEGERGAAEGFVAAEIPTAPRHTAPTPH